MSAGEGEESFAVMMKEMWIQNGSIKSLSGDLRWGDVLLHTKKPPKQRAWTPL